MSIKMKYYIKLTINSYPIISIYKKFNVEINPLILKSVYTGHHCNKILGILFLKRIKVEQDQYIEVTDEIINLIDKIIIIK